jgi:hypothetical protein
MKEQRTAGLPEPAPGASVVDLRFAGFGWIQTATAPVTME